MHSQLLIGYGEVQIRAGVRGLLFNRTLEEGNRFTWTIVQKGLRAELKGALTLLRDRK